MLLIIMAMVKGEIFMGPRSKSFRVSFSMLWRPPMPLPMITPGLIATLFILVIFAWNEFFFAVNLMAAKGATVPMFMIGFVTSEGLFWAKLAAAGTMGMLPVVLLGWAAQRQLVRGLSLGAVK